MMTRSWVVLAGAAHAAWASNDVQARVFSPLPGVAYLQAFVEPTIELTFGEGPLSNAVRGQPDGFEICLDWSAAARDDDGGGDSDGSNDSGDCCALALMLTGGDCASFWPPLETATAAPAPYRFKVWLQPAAATAHPATLVAARAAAAEAGGSSFAAATAVDVHYWVGAPPLPTATAAPTPPPPVADAAKSGAPKPGVGRSSRRRNGHATAAASRSGVGADGGLLRPVVLGVHFGHDAHVAVCYIA